ncbi:2'-5' RNA ligase family protein [Skermanella pratensis]|uniref:2'-5' RNA ligase family protein n=1 Tax=Skermanella pratensis TaxID=2233999 RepID=UPI001FE3B84E|nr:2'-5' RNA ligase family protein [Skermanella pratensis]
MTVRGGPAPLILTLGMDAGSFSRLDALRRAHFPAERNFLPAHLTLFHHLPGEDPAGIAAALRDVLAGRARPPLRATGLRFLGKGVAYAFDAPGLAELRAALAARWAGCLTPQDRQPFRPHVTIQNKADPAEARALLERLEAGFSPFEVVGESLLLWRYLGGPWQRLGEFPFEG